MKRNFPLNQERYLENLTNESSLQNGVCFSMTQDWLLNEMSATRKDKQYYKEVYRFFPRQRTYCEFNWLTLGENLVLKSDRYKAIDEKKLRCYEGQRIHQDNKNGFYFIAVVNDVDFYHCIGVSVNQKTYRVFDASHAEFEHFSHNEEESKMKLRCWIMEKYYSRKNAPYLIIARLSLK